MFYSDDKDADLVGCGFKILTLLHSFEAVFRKHGVLKKFENGLHSLFPALHAYRKLNVNFRTWAIEFKAAATFLTSPTSLRQDTNAGLKIVLQNTRLLKK